MLFDCSIYCIVYRISGIQVNVLDVWYVWYRYCLPFPLPDRTDSVRSYDTEPSGSLWQEEPSHSNKNFSAKPTHPILSHPIQTKPNQTKKIPVKDKTKSKTKKRQTPNTPKPNPTQPGENAEKKRYPHHRRRTGTGITTKQLIPPQPKLQSQSHQLPAANCSLTSYWLWKRFVAWMKSHLGVGYYFRC